MDDRLVSFPFDKHPHIAADAGVLSVLDFLTGKLMDLLGTGIRLIGNKVPLHT